MKLETRRLIIFPLTYEQLLLYVQAENKLEKELSLNEGNRTVPPALRDAFIETILPAVADPENDYLYSTLWTIVSKEHNQMVADLCFKGEPNEQGEIEIGYGTYEEFQGNGYMTEAIAAIANWAFVQPKVKTILAETDQQNIASHRILEKNNFKTYQTTEAMLLWRRHKP
jgi:[ribosomal protein S5]-alanine N-acetyltransferase